MNWNEFLIFCDDISELSSNPVLFPPLRMLFLCYDCQKLAAIP